MMPQTSWPATSLDQPRHVIAVELWDGAPGVRGVYKYSRDTRELFKCHGFETLVWEKAPGQYDEEKSLLWVFVGRRDEASGGD